MKILELLESSLSCATSSSSAHAPWLDARIKLYSRVKSSNANWEKLQFFTLFNELKIPRLQWDINLYYLPPIPWGRKLMIPYCCILWWSVLEDFRDNLISTCGVIYLENITCDMYIYQKPTGSSTDEPQI